MIKAYEFDFGQDNFDGLVQDSSALTMKLLQSCTEPSILLRKSMFGKMVFILKWGSAQQGESVLGSLVFSSLLMPWALIQYKDVILPV